MLGHVLCRWLEVVTLTPRHNLQSHDAICIALFAISFLYIVLKLTFFEVCTNLEKKI
jgi:hypothetical protein